MGIEGLGVEVEGVKVEIDDLEVGVIVEEFVYSESDVVGKTELLVG